MVLCNLQVHWADLEAAKEEERRKEIGFMIGSGWSKVTEAEAQSLLLGTSSNVLLVRSSCSLLK